MATLTTLYSLNSYCGFMKENATKKYHLFEAELAKEGMIMTFYNLLRKERDGIRKKEIEALNLFEVPSWIRTCMVLHLGFTHEDFDNNQIPNPSQTYLALCNFSI
ncbi:hypothetical protein [Flectobacillus major]|jgi:hypothetical protein|uniref:hypothetical protein n=1 Tax=Flectobacillus major TaxID=103 RepID=UPI00047A034E|nr:hypothetical protein [Flectobacillus major]